MAIQPFWYQAECLREVRKARKRGRRRSLVVMASGLGKTITVALDVKSWTKIRPKARVLYLCHQNDILAHARARFEVIVDNDESHHGYYHGESKFAEAKFLYASFQTMREEYRKFKPKEFDYIIVDESHHAQAETYRPVLDYFQPDFMLGLTATPDREDMKDIRDIFGQEVFSLPLEEALALGLLTKVDYRVLTEEALDLNEIKNPAGWSLKQLNKKLFVPKRDEEIGRIIEEKISAVKNPKTMIFCPSIRHADMLQKYVPNSMAVHSNLSKREQGMRIQAFRDGVINSILTVDKFNEGIDIPEVNVIVFLRSTQSSIVFYQQLGRGLRKVPGKKKVLVLDFVANAERIEMIHHLKERIQEEFERQPSIRKHPEGEQPPIIVEAGKFIFTENAKNVLDILRKIRAGYTKEVLIAQLQEEAKRLGRNLSREDINRSSKEGRTASGTAFVNTFGTWNKALEASELSMLVIKKYSKKDLINQLKSEGMRLKRKPGVKDIDRASKEGRMASLKTFQTKFGSWNKALEAAGFEIMAKKAYSRKDLIQQIKSKAEELKRVPTYADFKRTSKQATSLWIFSQFFGSWEKALEAAGLKEVMKKRLINQIKAEASKLGKAPSVEDINKASKEGRSASISTFTRTFGSWNKALGAAGLKTRVRKYAKKDLVDQLKNEAKELKRSPTQEDINKASKEGRAAHSATFVNAFGNWEKALKAAGLKKDKGHQKT